MVSQGYLGIKSLYGSEVLNQNYDTNIIRIENFKKIDSDELFVELSPGKQIPSINKTVSVSVFDQTKLLIIQLQLGSAANHHRIITNSILFGGYQHLRRLIEYRRARISIVYDGILINSEIVHLNAWRYLSVLLLERKDQLEAKKYFIENRVWFCFEFVASEELRNKLAALIRQLESDEATLEIDDITTAFLSNIISDTSHLPFQSQTIKHPNQLAPLRLAPLWRPCGEMPSRVDDDDNET